MHIDDYAELQAVIRIFLGKRNDIDADIPTLIGLIEDQFIHGVRLSDGRIKKIRLRALEKTLATTIDSNGNIAVPTDYNDDIVAAFLTTSPTTFLTRTDLQTLLTQFPRGNPGQPVSFARQAGNFIFGPDPDSEYSTTIIYRKKITILSDSDTTNEILTEIPNAYLYGSLIQAEAMIWNDERLPLWKRMFDDIIDSVSDEWVQENISGSGGVSRPDYATP